MDRINFLISIHRSLGKITVFVAATALSLYCSQESLNNSFFFKREGILSGNYWLLLSGHFSHINTPHLFLNLAAWTLIWLYGWKVCSGFVWTLLFAVSTIGTSLGLLFLVGVDWYSGLSGILHGLLMTVVLLRLFNDRSDYGAWLLFFIICVKLTYESFFQTTFYTANLIGAPVLTEAHLLGLISGIASWLLIICLRAFLTKHKKAPA